MLITSARGVPGTRGIGVVPLEPGRSLLAPQIPAQFYRLSQIQQSLESAGAVPILFRELYQS